MSETGPGSPVAAVIVNYNARAVLARCVDKLRAAGAGRIIVVDNASTDGSPEALAASEPEVEVVRQRRNLGDGTAANAGARLVAQPYLLVVNPDVSVGRQALAELAAVLDAEAEVAAVGPLIRDPTGDPYPSARDLSPTSSPVQFTPSSACSIRRTVGRVATVPSPTTPRTNEARDSDWVSGACVLVRKIAFDSIGGFDEGYFMYVEDLDLCWRLRRAGWRVRFEPAAVVTHDQGVSTRAHPYRMLLAHHRSTLRFARKSMAGRRSALVPIVAFGLAVRLGLACGPGIPRPPARRGS